MALLTREPGPSQGAEGTAAGVISAKLEPDRLPRGAVARTGLIDGLRSGHDRSLTLVSAPAGYGKSTLLAEWARPNRSARSRARDAGLDSVRPVAVAAFWTRPLLGLGKAGHR